MIDGAVCTPFRTRDHDERRPIFEIARRSVPYSIARRHDSDKNMVHRTIHDGTYSSEVVIESLANALFGRLFGCVWIFELLRKTGTIPEEPFPQISAPHNAFPVLLRTVVLKMAH